MLKVESFGGRVICEDRDLLSNWLSEVNEEFCFWSFSKWKICPWRDRLSRSGKPEQSIGRLTRLLKPVIVKHRYRDRIKLLQANGAIHDWPPTNMVIAAEKPLV